MESFTSPLARTLLTPFATAIPTGASVGGSDPSTEGLLKFTEPLTSYLILDRYAAPRRVWSLTCHNAPTFQPQPLSWPDTLASDSKPMAEPISVCAAAGGICPAATAAPTPVANAPA